MTAEELRNRTKNLGIKIAELIAILPEKRISNVIFNQVLRSGFSIGANYRTCRRAKSTRDFINKLKIVE